MASWNRDLPDPHAGDDLAYAEAWENRIPDVEYADEDEAGQLGLGVPGEQRAIPSLARRGLFDMRHDLGRAPTVQEWMDERR